MTGVVMSGYDPIISPCRLPRKQRAELTRIRWNTGLMDLAIFTDKIKLSLQISGLLLPVTKAINRMVVNHAARLHEGITDRRADKGKATLF